VRRLASNRADNRSVFRLVHIIENAIPPYAQLLDGINMLPRGNQAHKNFPVARLSGWLMFQLYFNPVQDLAALAARQTRQIIGDAF
jgi:hypothetical protein